MAKRKKRKKKKKGKKKGSKNWIAGAVKKPGAFGKATAKKIAKGIKSKNPTTRRRAVLARTFKKLAAKRKRKGK